MKAKIIIYSENLLIFHDFKSATVREAYNALVKEFGPCRADIRSIHRIVWKFKDARVYLRGDGVKQRVGYRTVQ